MARRHNFRWHRRPDGTLSLDCHGLFHDSLLLRVTTDRSRSSLSLEFDLGPGVFNIRRYYFYKFQFDGVTSIRINRERDWPGPFSKSELCYKPGWHKHTEGWAPLEEANAKGEFNDVLIGTAELNKETDGTLLFRVQATSDSDFELVLQAKTLSLEHRYGGPVTLDSVLDLARAPKHYIWRYRYPDPRHVDPPSSASWMRFINKLFYGDK